MILLYVPARAGSKGVKNKNMRLLNKKPLITYTLEIVDSLVKEFGNKVFPFVSTDSEKIAHICKDSNFTTEYRRPKKLSDDYSSITSGINHAVNWLEKKNVLVSSVLILQPTSPIRKPSDAIDLIDFFSKNNFESVFSVIPIKEHPNECLKIKDNSWEFIISPKKNQNRRQDYDDDFYFIDGSYYMASLDFIMNHDSLIIKKKSKPFILSNQFNIDIDNEEDLLLAEALLKTINKN